MIPYYFCVEVQFRLDLASTYPDLLMVRMPRVFVTQLEVLVTWEFYRGVGTNLVVGNW